MIKNYLFVLKFINSVKSIEIELQKGGLNDLIKWEHFIIRDWFHENKIKMKGTDTFKLNQTLDQ